MSSNRSKGLESLIRELRADFINGWIPIVQSTLTGSVASVTFSSIPSNFRSLALIIQARTDRSTIQDPVIWRANSDSGSNYARAFSYVTTNDTRLGGGSISTTYGYAGEAEGANSRASNFSPSIMFLLGYAKTDREKQSIAISQNFGGVALADIFMWQFASLWKSSSAISTLDLLPEIGTNFVSGSIFQLYGIL